MDCPTCGGNCVLPSEKVLDEIYDMYAACSLCPPDPLLDKNSPLHENIDSSAGRCKKCGKRHLDLVIGNALTVLKENGLFPPEASLREVGTPLIAFGYQIPYPPRLGNKSLVLIMDTITGNVADKIISEVPEIKGVIKRRGSQSQSVGLLDTGTAPHTYDLLSGCDMRCDVVASSFGELCIYKNQARIHIEFNNTKIKKMESLFLKGEFNNSFVVDSLSGPGTLGLLSILGGARKVVLNDAWLPAIHNAILNIRVNADILGVKIDFERENYDKLVGDKPVLMARAKGRAEILVYHGDIRELARVVEECDICLIDAFPSVNPAKYLLLCRDNAKKVVII